MSQVIIDYINSNKAIYTKDQLVSALLQSGYSQTEIDEAVGVAYVNAANVAIDTTPVLQVPDLPSDDACLPSAQAVDIRVSKNSSNFDMSKMYVPASMISRVGIVVGILVFTLSLVFIAIGFTTRVSVAGDVIGSFSTQAGSPNSMVAIEKASIKPGDYNINKSVTINKSNHTYTLKLVSVAVTDINMKFILSVNQQGSGADYLTGGSKDAKLFNSDGVEIDNNSNLSPDKNNGLAYSAYFPSGSDVVDGFVLFSQPTVLAKSNTFSFQFPNFPVIEGIELK